jgi:hypothetical protein
MKKQNRKAATEPSPRTAPAPARAWSARSQASRRKELDLARQIEALEGSIVFEQRKLQSAEAERDRGIGLSARGDARARWSLEDALKQIEGSGRVISAYREKIEALRAEIVALEPTPQQVAARAATQNEMAKVAVDCQQKIVEFDFMVIALRARLEGILAAKQKLAELGSKIDFASRDDFGSTPLREALARLPGQLAPETARWLDGFLGSDATLACRIDKEQIEFGETLAAAHVYRRGDEAMLNAADYKVATFVPPPVPTAMELEIAAGNKLDRSDERGFNIGDPRFRIAGMTR